MTITHKTPMSKGATRDLRLIRKELASLEPNTDKLFNLISGTKYNISIRH